MKLLLVLLFPLFFYTQIIGKVVRVKDGDTIVILDNNNNQTTVRVADIDTPEKGQDYYYVAKKFTSNFCNGKIVKVFSKGLDRYGRTIGFVYVNEKDLSAELLKNGLAWHYKKYSNRNDYAQLEIAARKKKLNIWSLKNPIKPSDFRKEN